MCIEMERVTTYLLCTVYLRTVIAYPFLSNRARLLFLHGELFLHGDIFDIRI